MAVRAAAHLRDHRAAGPVTVVTWLLVVAAGLASGAGIARIVLMSEPDVRDRYDAERKQRE